MMARVREWYQETHGSGVELVRHFLARFFDSEMVTSPDAWLKVAIGILAMLGSVGALMLQTYWQRYDLLRSDDSYFPLYRQGVRDDLTTFISLAMWITALLTAVQWQSLFPTLRDYLALASLPIRPRQIFQAKFTALALVFIVFVMVIALPTAVLFTMVITGQWQENPSIVVNIAAVFCAIAGACAAVFFSLLALQGALLNLLPGRWFAPVSTLVQGLIFLLTLGVLPFLGRQWMGPEWWPPQWFLGLWAMVMRASDGGGHKALLAVEIAPAAAVLSYALSYHRYRRLLLEAPVVRKSLWWEGTGWRLLELWIRDPREQAAFAFIWKTLSRSRTHRLVLLGYIGIAVACMMKGGAESTHGLTSSASIQYLVVLGPLALAIFVTVGLRYLFSLPVELRANWIFQTTEREGRDCWMAAVARFVVWCGIAPVYAATLPLTAAVLGLREALTAALLGFTLAAAVFEALFIPWQKLPFTCTYLPGKKNLLQTIVPYIYALPALAIVGRLFLYSLHERTAFIAVITFQVAAAWRIRQMRKKTWSQRALVFEDERDPDVMILGLESGRGIDAPTLHTHFVRDTGIPEFRSLTPDWLAEARQEQGGPLYWLETLAEDVRFGLRLIRKSAVLSAVLVATLSVGIGMNVSVFTLIDALALRARVDRDPDSFVEVVPKYLGGGHSWLGEVSPNEYLDYRDGTRSLASLSAYSSAWATIGRDQQDTWTLLVSCNFFSVYGLDRPKLGRLFLPSECAIPGQAPVVVVSEELWHDRLGGDPAIVGRVIRLNDQAFTVVGVAPRDFSGRINRAGLWIPYTAQPYLEPGESRFADPKNSWLVLNGRLKPAYTRYNAQSEFAIMARQQDALNPGRKTTVSVTDGSLLARLGETGRGPAAYWMLGFTMVLMSLVLLITCANVTTLLLSKAVARQREIAVRLSLGAARIRLLRMLLTESFLLTATAGAISVYMAYRVPAALFTFLAKRPPDFPLAPDWWIFAYMGGVVLLTGALCGLAPALESMKVDLTACLKGCGSVLGNASGAWLHNLLMTAQVAMSLVLIVTAGFFSQAHWRMFRTEHSYPTQKILVTPLRFTPRTTSGSAKALARQIANEVKTLPGVQSVGYNITVPFLTPNVVKVRLDGEADESARPVDVQWASPGYFETLQIPILRGRQFRETDNGSDPDHVPAVVSESFLRAFGFRMDPIGRSLKVELGPSIEVIGIAKDVDQDSANPDTPLLYPLRQLGTGQTNLLIRFDRDAQSSAEAVRNRIARAAPEMRLVPRTLQAFIDDEAADVWRVVELVLILGLTAFVLATTGIYGAVAFAVTQKTRDLGIRVALGAQSRDIVREVFLAGGKPVGRGLLAGLWLSLAMAATVRQAFRFTPVRLDTESPTMYVLAVALLAIAAVGAMVGPAHRAAGADPLNSLRSE